MLQRARGGREHAVGQVGVPVALVHLDIRRVAEAQQLVLVPGAALLAAVHGVFEGQLAAADGQVLPGDGQHGPAQRVRLVAAVHAEAAEEAGSQGVLHHEVRPGKLALHGHGQQVDDGVAVDAPAEGVGHVEEADAHVRFQGGSQVEQLVVHQRRQPGQVALRSRRRLKIAHRRTRAATHGAPVF
mgnify:CR=1 FL=1